MRACGVLFAFLAVILSFGANAQKVFRIDLDKPIHPMTERFAIKSIEKANDRGAALIILRIDTPGGYVSSVEGIQRAIITSRTPVVAYVAPVNARAASGGALVALACDLIAMAPGTTIGAAHPVLAPLIPMPPTPPQQPAPGGQPQPAAPGQGPEGDEMMRKVVNDLSAHVRTLAVNRGRNAELFEKMVRESLTLTEKEALEGKAIELVASDEGQIFVYLKSHSLRRFEGQEVTLKFDGVPTVTDIPMTVRERFLSALANPNLAYILLIMGALGLFIEFKSPGLIFPGVLGGIFILLWLMSTPIVPPNIVGLLLIVLGIVFFILEVKVVSYGMLGIGGVISLVIGSLLLYSKAPVEEMRVSLTVILPVALAFAGIISFLVYLAAKAYKNPVVTGEEGLIGQEGEVRTPIHPHRPGKVFVFGEYWNATGEHEIEAGQRVKIVGREGMTLKVEPLSEGG